MVMVAVRGTQLGGTPLEEQNDLCADWWLMDRDQPGYSFCDQFTEDEMNYFKQLLEFLHEVSQYEFYTLYCTNLYCKICIVNEVR